MLRRVHEILSRKFPKWVFEERNGPLDWSILPMEMKREIVKYADIKTRSCLRQCSRQDRQIIDSFKVIFPFVKIETDKDYVSLIVIERRSQILRVDLTRRKLRLRKKTVVKISENIEGSEYREYHSNQEFSVILESLLNVISHQNITIDTLNLAIKYPHDAVTKYLDSHYRVQYGPRRKTHIICSGMEFLSAQLYFLPVNETRIIGDLNTNWQSGRMMLAGKTYNIVPTGHLADFGETTFYKPSLLEFNLGALISGILWKMSTEMEFYYIPGLRIEELEYEGIANRFEGRITRHEKVIVLHLPNENSPERKLLVKITNCGVVIQKTAFDALVNIPKNSCLLNWMCSKCDTTVASWYFRKTTGIEELIE